MSAECTAKSAKISVTINPESIEKVNSNGHKQVKLVIRIHEYFRLLALVNSKTYRRALEKIETFGAENCSIILQGTLSLHHRIDRAGLTVYEKTKKVEPDNITLEATTVQYIPVEPKVPTRKVLSLKRKEPTE